MLEDDNQEWFRSNLTAVLLEGESNEGAHHNSVAEKNSRGLTAARAQDNRV